MIISDNYRYVFVEQPLTASTAMAAELVGYYDGRHVLSKHSNYSDFLSIATANQKRYAVMIGVRNPLDQIVSSYQKLITNHLNAFDDPVHFEENGGWISKRRRRMFKYAHGAGRDFNDYFNHFFAGPAVKTSQYLWCPKQYDYIIHFERLQQDFDNFLKHIGAEKVRDIPIVNKTAGKRDFVSYFNPATQATACYVFGPIMSAWGYDFPDDWNVRRAPVLAMLQFNIVNLIGKFVIDRLGVTPGHYQRLRSSLTRKSDSH